MFATRNIVITPDHAAGYMYVRCSSLKSAVAREHLLLATLPELSIQLLIIAREHGRITVASAQAQTKANRHTIRLHMGKLLAAGQLVQQGAGRGTWYSPAMQNS